MSSAGLKRPLRNAHRWRLWICADYVRRLSGRLRAFFHPVETRSPPVVEVGGIEPPSRMLPVCRNYDRADIMGAGARNSRKDEACDFGGVGGMVIRTPIVPPGHCRQGSHRARRWWSCGQLARQ